MSLGQQGPGGTAALGQPRMMQPMQGTGLKQLLQQVSVSLIGTAFQMYCVPTYLCIFMNLDCNYYFDGCCDETNGSQTQ